MSRANTRVVKIGDRVTEAEIRFCPVHDEYQNRRCGATVKQIQALTEAGCDIIRCAVPTMEAARALSRSKSRSRFRL